MNTGHLPVIIVLTVCLASQNLSLWMKFCALIFGKNDPSKNPEQNVRASLDKARFPEVSDQSCLDWKNLPNPLASFHPAYSQLSLLV